MSSRALRRAQKELEEKQLQEKLAQEAEDQDEESEEEASPRATAKPSLFALLDDGNDEDEEEEEASEDETKPSVESPEKVVISQPKSSKKSKKKKKKAKANAEKSASKTNTVSSNLDEIDQALLALSFTSKDQPDPESDHPDLAISEEKKHLFSVLSVDVQHLHAANEMKKLFGRAALQNMDDEARPRQQGGIAAATAGRNATGRNLASLGLRRNIFIQGKEEWPRATSGGLGMEIVERRSDGSVEYRFVHNTTYQEVQRQFEVCVAGMDPERMVQLLHYNPYHISTLLQVSEIAKQQRDNAGASDLLERALFTFGRSVHSTFSANLAAGKARLDFRRPENREFWLAVWRYIGTLGVRATWRTSLEWAKLLIAMQPEQDPYCVRLLIDQLALRGREPQAVVEFVEADYLEREWKIPPNLAFSVALAHDRLKQPQKARTSLRNAIKEYPWLAARLCKELDISPIPKPVWGKEPHDDYQELLCQLYVPKAKDLWNTTEGTSLLVEVCYSFEEDLGTGEDPYWLAQIPELDLARHVILSDDRSLLTLLNNDVKSKYKSVSDPLPPQDNLTSYSTSRSGGSRHQTPLNQEQLVAEITRIRDYFDRINPDDLGEDATQQSLIAALERAGTNLEEFRRNNERFQVIRMQMADMNDDELFELAVLGA